MSVGDSHTSVCAPELQTSLYTACDGILSSMAGVSVLNHERFVGKRWNRPREYYIYPQFPCSHAVPVAARSRRGCYRHFTAQWHRKPLYGVPKIGHLPACLMTGFEIAIRPIEV